MGPLGDLLQLLLGSSLPWDPVSLTLRVTGGYGVHPSLSPSCLHPVQAIALLYIPAPAPTSACSFWGF